MFRTSPVHHQECFVQAVLADLLWWKLHGGLHLTHNDLIQRLLETQNSIITIQGHYTMEDA